MLHFSLQVVVVELWRKKISESSILVRKILFFVFIDLSNWARAQPPYSVSECHPVSVLYSIKLIGVARIIGSSSVHALRVNICLINSIQLYIGWRKEKKKNSWLESAHGMLAKTSSWGKLRVCDIEPLRNEHLHRYNLSSPIMAHTLSSAHCACISDYQLQRLKLNESLNHPSSVWVDSTRKRLNRKNRAQHKKLSRLIFNGEKISALFYFLSNKVLRLLQESPKVVLFLFLRVNASLQQ